MIRLLLAVASSAAFAAGPIDLDVPANLQAVQRDRPEHYAKIERILVEAPKRALDTAFVARWLRTDFAASDVRYTDVLMTSLPPKKRLDFSLDNTAYTKVIEIDAAAEVQHVVQRLTLETRQGDCQAAQQLGDIYQQGATGVTPDAAEALKWYRTARVLGCDVPALRGSKN